MDHDCLAEFAVFAATLVLECNHALSSGSNASAAGRRVACNTEHRDVCQCSSGQHPWSEYGEWKMGGQLHSPSPGAIENEIGKPVPEVSTSVTNGIRYKENDVSKFGSWC